MKKMATSNFRSNFESRVASALTEAGVTWHYEDTCLKFIQPATKRRYTPDFLLGNGLILEVKGRLTASDRKKHKLIREQYPDLDLRFVFLNPYNRLYKGSPTTYAEWADKLGIEWCKGPEVPQEWLN